MEFSLVALVIKALATALVVVTASVAAERSGPFWGGLISCLPVSAGPAYVLLAMQQPDEFVAASALSSLLSNVAAWLFLLTNVVLLVRTRRFLPSYMTSLVVWFCAVLTLRLFAVGWLAALIANAIAFLIADKLAPRVMLASLPLALRIRGWYELPLRGLLVGIFVAAVVTLSDAIGPAATGIAAVFPIALSSLAVVTFRSMGPDGAAAALSSAIRPLVGIVMGLSAVYFAVPLWGEGIGLSVGLVASLIWPGYLILSRSRTRSA